MDQHLDAFVERRVDELPYLGKEPYDVLRCCVGNVKRQVDEGRVGELWLDGVRLLVLPHADNVRDAPVEQHLTAVLLGDEMGSQIEARDDFLHRLPHVAIRGGVGGDVVVERAHVHEVNAGRLEKQTNAICLLIAI